MDWLQRREFVTLLGGAAAWPLAVHAQQPGRVVRIGFVGPAIDRPSLMFVPNYQAFLAQLHVLGFVEGQNLIVTYGAVDDPRGLAVVAAELMQVQPELIVVSGTEPRRGSGVVASAPTRRTTEQASDWPIGCCVTRIFNFAI